MEKLLSALKAIPEYPLLLEALRSRQSAAITGAGQINRSHIIAALSQQLAQPVVVLCPDDSARQAAFGGTAGLSEGRCPRAAQPGTDPV